MEIFKICINAVLPLFFIMLTGYLFRVVGVVNQKDVLRMNSVSFKLFLPAMCFINIYDSDLAVLKDIKLGGFIVACILLNFLLGVLFVKRFVPDVKQKGVVLQTLFRTNFLVTALPMAKNLVGDVIDPQVGLLLFIIVPLFNILSVISMEAFNGEKIDLKALLVDMLKNPLIESFIFVIFLKAFHIRLPGSLESAVRSFGAMASTFALFLVGAFLDFGHVRDQFKQVMFLTVMRLIVVPALFLTISVAVGFRDASFVLLLGFFSSSVAAAAFTMSEQMGGDAMLAGNVVMMTSAFLPFTFFLWSMLFMNLGIF